MTHTLRLALAGLLLCAGGCMLPPAPPSDAVQDKSDAEFARGIDRPPTAQTLYSMARILATQGKEDDCRNTLVTIIRNYPEFMPAYNDLAEIQMRHRQMDDAMNTLNRGLKHSPSQPVLINNLGMCHLVQARYPEALEQFTRAAAFAPDNARYRANMATALGMLGRYDESLSLYQQIAPAHEAHYNLAVLAEARNDTARAQQEFTIARNLTPPPPPAKPAKAPASN